MNDRDLDRMLDEELVDLAALTSIATGRDRRALWDSVARLDPETSRRVAFTAAAVASEHRRRQVPA